MQGGDIASADPIGFPFQQSEWRQDEWCGEGRQQHCVQGREPWPAFGGLARDTFGQDDAPFAASDAGFTCSSSCAMHSDVPRQIALSYPAYARSVRRPPHTGQRSAAMGCLVVCGSRSDTGHLLGFGIAPAQVEISDNGGFRERVGKHRPAAVLLHAHFLARFPSHCRPSVAPPACRADPRTAVLQRTPTEFWQEKRPARRPLCTAFPRSSEGPRWGGPPVLAVTIAAPTARLPSLSA